MSGRLAVGLVAVLLVAGLGLAVGPGSEDVTRAQMPFPLLPPGFAPPPPPACADATGTSVLFPAPAPDCDPHQWAGYLHLGGAPIEGYGRYPHDFAGCAAWKHASCRTSNPALDQDPAELYGVSGMGIDQAWRLSTGRPDVVLAVIDSGVNWDSSDILEQAYLNLGELPPPGIPTDAWKAAPESFGYADYDANRDGVVSVADWAHDPRVLPTAGPSPQGQGLLDAQDLIWTFSDGTDDDGNGYTDDISGWNILDDDNDPWDEVRYGHGTGQGENAAGQANNGPGGTGSCPNCRILHVRQGQSFIAHVENYARGVLFAVDSGASVIQSALGSIDANQFALAAHKYAWSRGVPIVASAADEAAGHHNMPTNLLHAMNFNSIRPLDVSPGQASGWLYLNGCTNFMATLTASVSSSGCSSEAVAQASGIAGLLLSHAMDLHEAGALAAHPQARNVLSPNEVEQVLMSTADDVDFSLRNPVVPQPVPTTRYPTSPGYDPYTGAGRLNAAAALWALDAGRIPPEAELLAPRWWQQMDPAFEATVAVDALVGSLRGDGAYDWELAYACGIDPSAASFVVIATGSGVGRYVGPLATWDLAASGADACAHRQLGRVEDAYAATLRVRVTDSRGLVGEDRIPLSIRTDPARHVLSRHMGASGESSTAMVDMDGDNVVELLVPTSDGLIHALRGDGSSQPGFPLATDPLAVHGGSHAFASGAVLRPFESIGVGGIAVGDLDRDGRPEVVAATLVGKVYAWHHDGSRVEGFPVNANPLLAQRLLRDPLNPVMTGFVSQPVLGDLDGDGDLEIIQSGLDRHVYAWHHDGSPVPGFPHHVIDRATVGTETIGAMERVTGPTDGQTEIYRGGKIVATPTLADLDGDGLPEIVVGTNDHYREIPNWAADDIFLWPFGQFNFRADLIGSGNGRLFALDWNAAAGHVQDLPGWPVPIGVFVAELLPYVGEGIPTSAAAGDVDGDGVPEIAIFSTAGPAYLLRADGSSVYGHDAQGRPRTLGSTSRGALSNVADWPVMAAAGLPSMGDLDGDGDLDLVAPAVGLGRALDILLTGEQVVSDDAIQAWDLATGTALPAFPRRVEDLQFITNPTLVDIDGDGSLEILSGNGMGVLHAFGPLGTEPPGWPKHTGQWIIDAPATGDVDDDGLLEVAITTREGDLWVWDTLAPADSRRAWWSQHHDEWNTGNHDLDTLAPAAAVNVEIAPGGRLSWTAAGGDGPRGQADRVELIDEHGAVIGVRAAGAAGATQTWDIGCGLVGASLRPVDAVGNVGWPVPIPSVPFRPC